MKSSRSLLAVALFAALAGCAGTGPSVKSVGAASPTVAAVKMAAAEQRTMPVELKTIGKVEPINTIVVRAQVGGTLMHAHIKEGEMVHEGDKLFEIDARPFEMAVRQAEAALTHDRAQLAQSEAALARAQEQEEHAVKQLERYRQLAAEGVRSQEMAEQMAVEARVRRSSVEEDRAAIDRVRASMLAGEAALAAAKLNLSFCTIRSPINGRTGSLRVQPGNLIKANDADLITIHQISPTNVTFAIPEAKLAFLRQRMRTGAVAVNAAIPGDEAGGIAGRLGFLDSAVDTTTGTIRLKASFENTDARLWPGQFVNVRIELDQRANAIVVPLPALQAGQAGQFVYVVLPDGRVEMRAVTAGPRDDRGISIEGVKAGEQVVTEGHLRIAPGVKVRPAS